MRAFQYQYGRRKHMSNEICNGILYGVLLLGDGRNRVFQRLGEGKLISQPVTLSG